MTFPLIQQPSPLQQLAGLMQNLRQQAMEAQMQREEISRRREYLALAQQEAAGNAAYRTDQTRRADRAFEYGVERDKVGDAAAADTAALRRRATHTAETNNLYDQARQALPPGYTATPQALLDIAKGRNDLTSLPQGRPGLQGSATRAPTPASAGGITHTPGVLSYNAPSGGGTGGGRGAADERRMLGISNARAMVEANQALNALEESDPTSRQRGFGSVLLRGVAGRIGHLAAGEEGRDAAGNIGLTDNQTQHERTLEQWIHNYLPNIPGFRMSVPMFNSVKRAFSLPSGEESEQIGTDVTRRRNLITEGVVRARAAGLTEEQYAQEVVRLWREGGAVEAANELEMALRAGGIVPGANSAGQPVGVPSASQPSQSALDRYLSRVP